MSLAASTSAYNGDIDLDTAELSISGILRFAHWVQGCGELEPSLACLAELFDATRCALIRVNSESMAVEFIGAGDASEDRDEDHLVETFAAHILASDLRREHKGSVRFLSRMTQLPYRLRGGVDRQLADLNIEDIAFVCLDAGESGIVLLEFQYSVRPDSRCRRIVDWIVPKLLRAYGAGRHRQIDTEISKMQGMIADRDGHLANSDAQPILSVENPAGLTRCEWRVCELASRGLAAKSIACELDVTCNTVRTHLRSIYYKTGVTGYHELVFALISQAAREKTFPRLVALPRAANT